MTDQNHSRSFHEALRRLGIQNPNELGIRTPIQAVILVDDVRHLMRPMQNPVRWGGVDVTPGVALFGALRLSAGAAGARVLAFGDANNSDIHAVAPSPAGFTSVAVLTPDISAGDITTATTAVLDHGTRVALVGTMLLQSQFVHYPLPFYLEPGHSFEIMNDTTNDIWQPWILWEEFPERASIDDAG